MVQQERKFINHLSGEAAPVVPPADPYDDVLAVSSVRAAYRGDKGITLNGSDVSGWADQANIDATDYDLVQATPADQPLYVASSANFNGHPCIQFDGGTEFLKTGVINDFTDNMTVFLVYKILANDGSEGIFEIYSGVVNSGLNYLISQAGSGKHTLRARSGGVNRDRVWNDLTYSTEILEATLDANTLMRYMINEVKIDDDDTGYTTIDNIIANFTLGRINLTGWPSNIEVAEWIICDDVLSYADKWTIRDYLNGRYNLFTEIDAFSDISDLEVLFDARDASSITESGGKVSAWQDSVGGYTVTQSTEAEKPTYNSSGGPNNSAYIEADGVDDNLISNNDFQGGAGKTWFYVHKLTANDPNAVLMSPANSNTGHTVMMTAGGAHVMFSNGTLQGYLTMTTGQWYISIVRNNGAAGDDIWADTIQTDTGNQGSAANNGFSFFRRQDGIAPYTGGLVLMGCYDKILSDEEMRQLSRFLNKEFDRI